MTRRKTRPALHSEVTPGMSMRDISAAMGMSKSEIERCIRLSELPQAVFEERLRDHQAKGKRPTPASMMQPVPARGRVQRAIALVAGMTPEERSEFSQRLNAEVVDDAH